MLSERDGDCSSSELAAECSLAVVCSLSIAAMPPSMDGVERPPVVLCACWNACTSLSQWELPSLLLEMQRQGDCTKGRCSAC